MFGSAGCFRGLLVNADSKRNVFGVGEVTDVVKFCDLEKLLRLTVYVCLFVGNLKLQKKDSNLIVGELELPRFLRLRKCGYVMNNHLFQREVKNLKS